jgi:ABC-type Mn2+/Zn2+ transport system permease subunit
LTALIAILSVTLACAVLSGFVIARRWAFVGEGIGHSGFGGAGTAWLLACVFPALDKPEIPYLFVLAFSFIAAAGIAYMSRKERLSGDASVGIFLVASVAWGFVGQNVYFYVNNAQPAGFVTLFFGAPSAVSVQYAVCSTMVAAAVILAVVMMRKEMLAYCVDPVLAQTSGVRAGLMHYTLIGLIALVIAVGVHVVGTLLVTALLILPGASASKLAKSMRSHSMVCVTVAMLGAVAGYGVNVVYPFLPIGPSVVLAMCVLFLISVVLGKWGKI